MGSLSSANKSAIEVLDRRLLPVTYKDRTAEVPVYIVKSLNEKAIAGMDLINDLGICYDPRVSDFVSAVQEDDDPRVLISTAQEVYMRPMEARPCKLKMSNWDPNDTMVAVDIGSEGVPALFANEGVSTVFDDDKTVFMLKNCSGEELRLPRGYPVGLAQPISQINAVRTDDFLENISTKLPPPMSEERRKQFLNDVNINVPVGQHAAYSELLCKNYDVFSKNPEDLGKASHFQHNIELKNHEPVFRKQFRIPEEYQTALRNQVKEWL